VIATGIVTALMFAAPAFGGISDEQLAACMWEKSATSTATFVDSADGGQTFTLYMKAATPCADAMPKGINLNSLKKKLAKMRPAEIKPDQPTSDAAFVCPRGADGKPLDCKPAGE